MYQERQLFINDLNTFVTCCKDSLNNVLEVLDWSRESIYSACQEQSQESAPKNDGNDGLPSPDEISSASESKEMLQYNSHISYNIGFLVQLTLFHLCLGLNNETVGSNPLYKELVESLSKPTATKQDEKSRTETLVEMLKMERDAKRRRVNYKNRVHTKNKSHMEILREVLAEQMSTLSQLAEKENPVAAKEEETRKIDPSEELLDIRFHDGNPYLAWKTVLKMQSSLDRKLQQEDFDERNRERCIYCDDEKFRNRDRRDKKSEFSRVRNSKNNEDRSYSRYISPKLNEKDSKNSHSKYDEGSIVSRHMSPKEHKSLDLKYSGSRDEENVSDYKHKEKHRHERSYRDHQDYSSDINYMRYNRDNDKYVKQRSSRHSDSDDRTQKRREYSSFNEEDYRSYKNKKHKRDHSHSVSPSSHKSKKHKSKHKRH